MDKNMVKVNSLIMINIKLIMLDSLNKIKYQGEVYLTASIIDIKENGYKEKCMVMGLVIGIIEVYYIIIYK